MARPKSPADSKVPIKTHSGEIVTLGRVRQALSLISTLKHFLPDLNYQGKEACARAREQMLALYNSGQITNEDIANYLIDSRKLRGMFVDTAPAAPPSFMSNNSSPDGRGRVREEGRVLPPLKPGPKGQSEERGSMPIGGEGLRQKMSERRALYMKAYDLLGAPPNDIALVDSVVFDEVMLEHYQDIYAQAVEDKLESNVNTVTLNNQITNLQSRLRVNQQSLQIDMKSRKSKEDEVDGVEQHMRIVEEAARHTKQYITYLEHCSIRIAIGIGLFDHPDNQLHGYCPRCGRTVSTRLKSVAIQFDPDADPSGPPEVIYLEQAKVEDKWE